MNVRDLRLSLSLAATLVAAASSLTPTPSPAAPPAASDEAHAAMRIETDLFVGDAATPSARSTTLFCDGVAWDFLEVPEAADRGGAERMTLREIALHDPARERVIVVDHLRGLKTQVDAIRLERLSVSLAKWARGTEDRLVRWAGGPDFSDGMREADDAIELVGPRVRYAVHREDAPSAEAARAYRQFADTAILLRALLHPGGIPPFPRLALNRRLEASGSIPTEVSLEIDPRLAPVVGRAAKLRSVHKLHPRLLDEDTRRIEDAASRMAAAKEVDLAEFAGRADAGAPAGEPGGRQP